MYEITISIDGMSCQHCVMRVKKAIDALTGVISSEVEIGKAIVNANESRISREDIEKVVQEAGYKIRR